MAKGPTIIIGRGPKDRSPFSLQRHGVKADPNKDYRWVDPKRIEERKYNDGYKFVKGAQSSDGTYRTKGNMVLMERPKDLSVEAAKEKVERTREMTRRVRSNFRETIENLSSKHGVDLHKSVDHLDNEQ